MRNAYHARARQAIDQIASKHEGTIFGGSMSWKRLPTYLANLRLRLMPFNEQQKKAYEETGHVQQIAFKLTPRVGKIEIKRFLESVYGLKVESVHTLNYEGKKKRRKTGTFRESDFKKAYVTLKPPDTKQRTA